MTDTSIYEMIAKRTGGNIYIGVVGPVRTGKSTFIRRFLDSAVLPEMEDEYDRARAQDEIPQSGSGKTVMTTEPKFVPDDAVHLKIGDSECNIKMIDCVGYMVDGAFGGEDDGEERMVMTPWDGEAMPFSRAAEIGTQKVIGEHATIAVLVTTDGSFTDIPRENYIPAEERVASELKSYGKPFVIVLNSKDPQNAEAVTCAEEMEEKYGVPVALVSCPNLDRQDMNEILSLILGEFPIKELSFRLPQWYRLLPKDHVMRKETMQTISDFSDHVRKFGDIPRALGETEGIAQTSLDAGEGIGRFTLPCSREKFFEIVNGLTGFEITDDESLFATLSALAEMKKKYDTVAGALLDVEEKGYGIVMPKEEDIDFSEPELVKQSGGYGVKISARAETVHLIRTAIKSDYCPVIGSERQSEEVLKQLLEEYGDDPKKMMKFEMFGKTLYDLVSDGMSAKLSHMSEESREKFGETLGKIIDEGSNGLICILL